jgi:hypothetical protein
VLERGNQMGKWRNTMKHIILLLLAFSVCLAQVPNEVSMDSIKMDIQNLYTKQREMKNFVDSLGNVKNEALHESHEFYSSSFKDLLTVVGIFIAIIGIVVVFILYGLEKAVKNGTTTINDLEKKYKEIKSKSEKLFAIQGGDYYESANKSLEEKAFSEHFLYMHSIFECLRTRIELAEEHNLEKISEDLKKDRIFTEKYEGILEENNEENKEKLKEVVYIDGKNDKDFKFCMFVKSLLDFMNYCEDMRKTKPLEIANFIYNKLCDLFDYDKIKERLEKYLKLRAFGDSHKILGLAKKYRE